MTANFQVTDEKSGQTLDYGLLFDSKGMVLFNPYHIDFLTKDQKAVLAKFITKEGAITELACDTLESFIRSHDFDFDSDVIRLWYAIIGRSIAYCSIAEFWR